MWREMVGNLVIVAIIVGDALKNKLIDIVVTFSYCSFCTVLFMYQYIISYSLASTIINTNSCRCVKNAMNPKIEASICSVLMISGW